MVGFSWPGVVWRIAALPGAFELRTQAALLAAKAAAEARAPGHTVDAALEHSYRQVHAKLPRSAHQRTLVCASFTAAATLADSTSNNKAR